MKQTITNMYLKNKRVLLRVDYNIPIKDNHILDDTKIIKSLETINYLLTQDCKIIIMSHLGRIKTEEDKATNSLEPVKTVLENALHIPIKFAKDILASETKEMALNLQSKEILLLENTRFLDIPEPKESTYNDEVAQYLASLGEVFVMDAFASAHRQHTSVIGPSHYLPSCLGFLATKEMQTLDKLSNPSKPFTVIMGGAKVDDKLPIIKSLLPKCDHILLSGGLANSFLAVLGLNVGSSLKTSSEDIKKELKKLLLTYKDKFALPLDAITQATYENTINLKNINKIDNNDVIKDIGTKTLQKYNQIINTSNTIFLNGTMGIYEEKEFSNGTREIFNYLKNSNALVVIGGGDTSSALKNLGYAGSFENTLSGGGASLEYIAYGHLPGIDALNEADEIEVLDL